MSLSDKSDEFAFSGDNFSGKVRLFPLPNLVLFPHVMQPLRIFEPRYRDILEEAVAEDQLIAMALLAAGWESDYEGRPLIHPVACLGRVLVHHQTEGGSYNLLISGLKRVRIVRELPPRKRFREAEAVICEDWYPPDGAAEGSLLHRQLRNGLLRIVHRLPQVLEQVDYLLGADVTLSVLTDMISYMLDLELDEKQGLLAECNIHRRARILIGRLETAAHDDEPGRGGVIEFPPQFSSN